MSIKKSNPPKAKAKKKTKKSVAKLTAVSLLGKIAPDFGIPSDTGEIIKLKHFRGKRVVLYFYPKDDTPGCTTQAQSFRDSKQVFSRNNAVVIGVSKDTVERHSKFKTKHQLNFILASDTDAEVCETYGVWKEKNMYGRKYMGIERSTFLIDEKGKVRAEWRKVRVSGHVDEVVGTLKSL